MFDRVLLILLVLLLPLGIVVSRVVTGEMSIGKPNSFADSEKKIEAMMEKFNQGMAASSLSQKELVMTGVIYASESGTIKMAGVAPKADSFIWVWIAGMGMNTPKLEVPASGSAVKSAKWEGPLVVSPSNGGVFAVEVEAKQYVGVVEIILEQGKSRTTVRFDVDKRIQVN